MGTKKIMKYCLLADNDDFFIAKSIDGSISFLNSNLDYSCCRGQLGSFHIDTNNGKMANIYLSNEEVSLTFNNPLDRLIKAFSLNHNFLPVYYDVHRTKNMIKNYQYLDSMNTEEFLMIEMLTNFLDSIDGKIGRINSLYLMRQLGDNQSSNTEFVKKKGGVLQRIIETNYIQDYNKMNLILINEIVKKNNLKEINEISETIKYHSLIFLHDIINKRKIINNKITNSKLLVFIKKYIPKYIKNLLKNPFIKNKNINYIEIDKINNFLKNR